MKLNDETVAKMVRQRLALGSSAQLIMQGDSMRPLLRSGDAVLLTAAAADALQRGDVVTILTNDGLLTHRYWTTITIDGRSYLQTRGDNNQRPDFPVPATNLVGRVIARQRDGRLALDAGRGAWLNQQLTRLAAQEATHGKWYRRLIRIWKHVLIGIVSMFTTQRS